MFLQAVTVDETMAGDDSTQGQLTTDRETIMQWAEEFDVVPVRTTGAGGASPYELQPRPEAEQSETMETVSWDEFFETVENDELVVLFYGEGAAQPFEVVEHEQAISRAPLEASEIEERLLAGETVTSEITETTVVERTIVEHATIESEVVETELLDSQVVDVALQSREVGGCNVLDRKILDEADPARFENMDQLVGLQEELPDAMPVEVDIRENWSVTRELLERSIIESRVVDVDVSETDEVESETIDTSIDIEGVQETLFESGIIETEADPKEVIEAGTIESEFHEDDVIRSELTQRRLVTDEIMEENVLLGTLTEREVLQAETTATTPIETAFVNAETLDADVTPVGVTEYETEPPAGEPAETEPAEAGTGGDVEVVLTEEDEGKPVIDAGGEAIGMVEEVREGTAYVDPDPGIVDRIRMKLGWGEADEEDYPIGEENIEEVTDDEVRLRVPE